MHAAVKNACRRWWWLSREFNTGSTPICSEPLLTLTTVRVINVARTMGRDSQSCHTDSCTRCCLQFSLLVPINMLASIYLSVCLSVFLSACLPVCLPACLPICLSVCLYLSVRPSIHPSIHLDMQRVCNAFCGAFAKLWKAVISFFISVRLSVWNSRLPLDGFSSNLTFDLFYCFILIFFSIIIFIWLFI